MAEFDGDREEVLERARREGVGCILTVGFDLPSSREAVELAEVHPMLIAAVGFHPHNASQMRPEDLEELRLLAGRPKVVAIGEIGLDFYRNLSPREAQFEALASQLALARELGLPVIIHSRNAYHEIISILLSCPGSRRGVIHCFSGDLETLHGCLDLGFFVSIAGNVTYSREVAQVLPSIPVDRLLLETDSPYLTPEPYRGHRNEPARLPLVLEKVAEIKGISTSALENVTTENALRLFRPIVPQGGGD